MFRPIKNKEELAKIKSIARSMIVDEFNFSLKWLELNNFVVLAQQSVFHIDVEYSSKLVTTFCQFGITELYAVLLEDLLATEAAYELSVTVDDLMLFDFKYGPFSCIIFPKGEITFAILFTINDYFLIASTEDFLNAYAIDLKLARQGFVEFVNNHFDIVKPRLIPVISYMDWIQKTSG